MIPLGLMSADVDGPGLDDRILFSGDLDIVSPGLGDGDLFLP